MSNAEISSTTVPAMGEGPSAEIGALLQRRLVSAIDLHLTLEHVRWNVVGPHVAAIHEMLEQQVADVRLQSGQLAARIAALGGEPVGTPGAVTAIRRWEDYDLKRADAADHLSRLDAVYAGVIGDHRDVAARMAELDPVSQDLLLGQLRTLESHQRVVRAHIGGTDDSEAR